MQNGFNLSAWMDHELYPALFERLETSFPTFNFVRRGRAWVATTWPADFPVTVNDPRPDRLMVYENAPFIVKVHGYVGGVRLLDLVNGGRKPTAPEFLSVLRQLATLAGLVLPEREVDEAELHALRDEEERRAVLESTITVSQGVFWSSLGAEARGYFHGRGFTDEELRDLGLGLHQAAAVRGALASRHSADAIRKSGVLWDRLEGYVMLPWHDAFGRLLTLYGRWPATTPPDGQPKTIALPGEGTKASPLFFNRAREGGHHHLVAVEGLLDAAMAQVRGDSRVVAYVAATFSHAQIETLRRHRVERVTLVGDPDGGGDRGTRQNVDLLLRAGIRCYVPPRLPDGTDPDEFILREGIEAWRAHIDRGVSGGVWVAAQFLADIHPETSAEKTDEALGQVATFIKQFLTDNAWADQDRDAIITLAAARTGRPRRTLLRLLTPPRAKTATAPPRVQAEAARGGGAEVEHLSDLGNARRLARLHGTDIHWVKQWGACYLFDGRLWNEDRTEQILRWAEDVVRDLYAEAARTDDVTRRAALAAWALQSESLWRLRAMMDLLKGQPGIATVPEAFDADPWLLSCPNGVLDLKTFARRPHRREDRLTKITAAPFTLEARSEVWERFLTENVPDPDTITTLQRFAGYSLTGDTRHEEFAFLHGPVGSGKSTMLEALKRTVGTYGHAASFTTFLRSKRDEGGPSDDRAELRGKRLVIATETEGDREWAVGIVKWLTGGDTVRARYLYQNSFEFVPIFKLWLGANEQPRVPASEGAFWRRILEVPFPTARPDEEQRDPRIKATLIDPAQSGAAILAWMVEGCRQWQASGLGVSAAVRKATTDYREAMDSVSQFLADCCILGTIGVTTPVTTPAALRAAYVAWCREAGLRPVVGKEWTTALHEKGLKRTRVVRGGKRHWIGVSLIDPPGPADEVPW